LRRSDDVCEQDRAQNPIDLRYGMYPGNELLDLVEHPGVVAEPWIVFDPGNLDVACPGDVRGEMPPMPDVDDLVIRWPDRLAGSAFSRSIVALRLPLEEAMLT